MIHCHVSNTDSCWGEAAPFVRAVWPSGTLLLGGGKGRAHTHIFSMNLKAAVREKRERERERERERGEKSACSCPLTHLSVS